MVIVVVLVGDDGFPSRASATRVTTRVAERRRQIAPDIPPTLTKEKLKGLWILLVPVATLVLIQRIPRGRWMGGRWS